MNKAGWFQFCSLSNLNEPLSRKKVNANKEKQVKGTFILTHDLTNEGGDLKSLNFDFAHQNNFNLFRGKKNTAALLQRCLEMSSASTVYQSDWIYVDDTWLSGDEVAKVKLVFWTKLLMLLTKCERRRLLNISPSGFSDLSVSEWMRGKEIWLCRSSVYFHLGIHWFLCLFKFRFIGLFLKDSECWKIGKSFCTFEWTHVKLLVFLFERQFKSLVLHFVNNFTSFLIKWLIKTVVVWLVCYTIKN